MALGYRDSFHLQFVAVPHVPGDRRVPARKLRMMAVQATVRLDAGKGGGRAIAAAQE